MRHPVLHALALVAVATGIASCARRAPVAPAATVTATPAAARLAAGQKVVESVCVSCHTGQMPPKTAPPLAMVARHYLDATGDSARAVDRIVAWVRSPAADRSLLPPMAVQRFGLMPPLALPDSTLRAAAAYVVSLAAAGGRHRGHQGSGPHGGPPRGAGPAPTP